MKTTSFRNLCRSRKLVVTQNLLEVLVCCVELSKNLKAGPPPELQTTERTSCFAAVTFWRKRSAALFRSSAAG